MTCYSPFIRIEDKSKWVKAQDGHLYHPAVIQKASNLLGERLEDADQRTWNIAIRHGYTPIPCNNCIGCRLDYSREWANRGYLESKCWEQNYWVTLTYDEDHNFILDEIETSDGITYSNDDGLWNGTLIPEDLTQFIKNVRQIMKREYNQDGIRFMACGEYGDQYERPHYHIIFFNLKLPTETFYNPRIKNNECYWQNTVIERAWNHKGLCDITDATWNNIAYTARYITKKVNGKGSEYHYAEKGQTKEFFRVSNRPGIGKLYYDKYKHEIYKNDEIIIKNQSGIISSKPPKYFDNLYEKEFPKEFEKIKNHRKKMSYYKNKIKDQTFSYGRLQNLEIEAKTKAETTQALIRTFERSTH